MIDRLAHDLSIAFPNVKGFSPRNLKYMRAFAQAWQDKAIVQEVLAQLPWYHHIALLDKLNSAETRYWYVLKTIENNWSRNVLVMQVESLKDPYLFDFLALTDKAQEREIEGVLVKHVTETHSITEGLPREIELRKQQYEYYHDLLLSFPKPEVVV